ncbi:MAG: efflux RND transporter periplasmic adaptor subunit, partial [Anaerolineales bacterium]|nr:efflux RND transporter periplasmic adaptor subunit [Anaerolineales bacterium]
EDYANKPETNLTRAAMELKLAEAQRRYDDAVRLVNNLEAETNDIDMAIAQANLAVAEASLAVAEQDLEELKDGPDPDLLEMAQARLDNAEAAIPLAQSLVDAAQANLDLLQVQMDKLTVSAPIDGLVLNRLAEPGEIVLAGSPILTIGTLQDTTITVYIPEDRYGQIDVGDKAAVTVDSFPGETFTAEVKRIADQAEYTPRNVQTEEERRTTVFAIELSVTNTDGKLKPGMPADVNFGVE